MNNMRVCSGIVIVLSLALAACTSTAGPTAAPAEIEGVQTEQPAIPLKVANYQYLSNAPLFIAEAEGYFEAQGLDVELIDFGSASNEIVPGLIAGRLDAAGISVGSAMLNAALQGNHVKAVADKGYFDPEGCATNAWVGSKQFLASGAADDLSMIKGKRVASTVGGAMEYTLDLLLAQEGLTQADIEHVAIEQSAARIEALGNGSLDVSVLSEPWVTRALEAGAGEVWVPVSALAPNLSVGAIVFGPSILDDNPEAGRRFMIAYLQAVRQYNEGKTDRNVEIIARYTKQEPDDIRKSCWTTFKADGTIDIEGMLAYQEWSIEKGYMDGRMEVSQFYDTSFLQYAQEHMGE